MPWMKEIKAFCGKNPQYKVAAHLPMSRDEDTPILCPAPWPLLVLLNWFLSCLRKSKLAWHQLISTSASKPEELLHGGTFPGLATYPEVSSSLYLAKVFVKLASNPAISQQSDCSTAAVPAPPQSWDVQQLLHTDEEKPEPSSGALNRSLTSDMFIFLSAMNYPFPAKVRAFHLLITKATSTAGNCPPAWFDGKGCK